MLAYLQSLLNRAKFEHASYARLQILAGLFLLNSREKIANFLQLPILIEKIYFTVWWHILCIVSRTVEILGENFYDAK